MYTITINYADGSTEVITDHIDFVLGFLTGVDDCNGCFRSITIKQAV
jgi:hypothetical protein